MEFALKLIGIYLVIGAWIGVFYVPRPQLTFDYISRVVVMAVGWAILLPIFKILETMP